MSRRALRPQADTPNNLDERNVRATQANDVMETEQAFRQDSFAESNFGVSTRGDGSFEYSDYDDQSVNRSQSFMDGTEGPALLAFVEDYILGHRLEILDTCETEDDIASCSSSSSGSETCFSHDDSKVYKRNKLDSKGFIPKNTESAKIGALECAFNQNETAKKSRWDSLLQSLAASKRNDHASHQTNTLLPNTLLPSQKSDNIQLPRPNFLASIKAKTDSNDTATTSEVVDDSTSKPSDVLHLLRKRLSPIAKPANKIEAPALTSTSTAYRRALDRLHRIRTETEKRVVSKTDQTGKNDAGSGRESLIIFEESQGEHTSKYLFDDMQLKNKKDNLAACIRKSPKIAAEPVGIKFPADTDEKDICFSVHSEGVEIPNIPHVAIAARSPSRARADKHFLRGRGRSVRAEKLVATCSGNCNEGKSAMMAQKCISEQIESKTIHKPIICSRCRGVLTDDSVCALLSNQSENTDAQLPENVVLQLAPLLTDHTSALPQALHPRQTIENQFDADIPRDGDTTGTCIDVETNVNAKRRVDVTNEMLDPKIEKSNQELTFGLADHVSASAPAIEVETTRKRELVATIDAKNETTTTNGSPHGKAATPTVQIEFNNWAENDIEIIKDSPRRTRLPWKQGKMSPSKTQPPVGADTRSILAQDQHIQVEGNFPSSASVCNYEMTMNKAQENHPRSRFFGRESTKLSSNSKAVLISPVNMLPSVSEDIDDAVSQGNTECCLESVATSMTSRVVNEKDDSSATTEVELEEQSNPDNNDNDEAYILERAMQQVHAEGKYAPGNSRTRRYITSPVTLYRFLDFNPCRNELVQENSYDFMYDPIGLSVCQMPKVDPTVNFGIDGKQEVTNSQIDSKSQGMVSKAMKPATQKPGSSLKKVLRRISKPNKVAFRENLVDICSKDSERKHSFPTPYELNVDSKTSEIFSDTANPNAKSSFQSRSGSEATENVRERSKNAVKDKLKALLTEKSKAKIKRIGIESMDMLRSSSNKSIGSATKAFAALKAEYTKRRESIYKSESPLNKTINTKKRNSVESKSHAAKILEEFKKAQADGKLQRGTVTERENDIAAQNQVQSDSTIVTYGTKQSQMSTLSKLTVEEKKLAHRLLNDIQLLAMIEKKRQAMGQVQSSLKCADIDKSVQLLKSIEASRRNRHISKDDSTAPPQGPSENQKSDDSLTKNTSVFGGISMFTGSEMTSSKTVNN